MKLPPGPLVLGLCLASLAGWEPLRAVEQAPAAVLSLTDALLGAAMPRDPRLDDEAGREARVQRARSAWRRWIDEVSARPPVREPGHDTLVAPVLRHDALRHELIVRAPERGVGVDSPVTHRGALLGFVRPWVRGSRETVRDGQLRVALLGHPLARPVAAAWQAGPHAAAVHFLLESDGDGPRVAHTSREIEPQHGQLAWTRDVEALGDRVPAGLLLGRFDGGRMDRPGGGVQASPSRIVPLVEVQSLGHVTLEVELGQQLAAREIPAKLLSAVGGRARRALDRGRLHGVVPGDLVVQEGVLVGVVESVGPLTAQVRVGCGDGPLLVADAGGELTHVSADRASWPADWTPREGQAVFSGHRLLGGLVVGSVRGVDADGLLVEPVPVDVERPVLVVEP